jgi:hypothetical protein
MEKVFLKWRRKWGGGALNAAVGASAKTDYEKKKYQ